MVGRGGQGMPGGRAGQEGGATPGHIDRAGSPLLFCPLRRNQEPLHLIDSSSESSPPIFPVHTSVSESESSAFDLALYFPGFFLFWLRIDPFEFLRLDCRSELDFLGFSSSASESDVSLFFDDHHRFFFFFLGDFSYSDSEPDDDDDECRLPFFLLCLCDLSVSEPDDIFSAFTAAPIPVPGGKAPP